MKKVEIRERETIGFVDHTIIDRAEYNRGLYCWIDIPTPSLSIQHILRFFSEKRVGIFGNATRTASRTFS